MCVFFFFKQKTAYEMRISDWSSDVCSSDLLWLQHDRDLAHPDGSAAGRGQTITGGSEKAGSGFADLDRRPFGGGAFGGDRQCLVMALAIKQEEAADHFLGF